MASSKTKVVGSNQAEPTFFAKKKCARNTFFATEKTKKILDEKKILVPMGNGPDHLPSRCQCRRVLRGKLVTLVNGYPFTRVTEWSSLHSCFLVILILGNFSLIFKT